MKTSEIIWTGSPDDQTARINDYVLRAEKMDFGFWWWCVYFQDEEIERGDEFCRSDAKQAAEAAYREHLNKK